MKTKIGSIEFPTKAMATEYVSNLLSKYTLGQVVDADDYEFLLALLSRHHEHQEKEGCGVAFFSRGQHPEYKTACFLLHRLDGSHTDFSTVTCIRGQGPSLIAEWREACRQAVDSRVHDQKNTVYDADSGRVVCPETNEVLEKGQYWLVQSDPPWAKVVDDFIASSGVEPSRGDITDPADNQYWAEFKDPELARKVVEFHAPLMNLVPKRLKA